MARTAKRGLALETRAVETWARSQKSPDDGAAPATAPITQRMQEIFERGEYDRTASGLFQLRPAAVGAETMTCLIQELEGDMLLIFVSDTRKGHIRRLLVTRDAEIWLDVDGVAIPHWGKYAAAAMTILAKRAFEREHAALRNCSLSV
jgi:hypothetical protein